MMRTRNSYVDVYDPDSYISDSEDTLWKTPSVYPGYSVATPTRSSGTHPYGVKPLNHEVRSINFIGTKFSV